MEDKNTKNKREKAFFIQNPRIFLVYLLFNNSLSKHWGGREYFTVILLLCDFRELFCDLCY